MLDGILFPHKWRETGGREPGSNGGRKSTGGRRREGGIFKETVAGRNRK